MFRVTTFSVLVVLALPLAAAEPVAIAREGDASADLLAVSLAGGASATGTCLDVPAPGAWCVHGAALSTHGPARAGLLAANAHGDATNSHGCFVDSQFGVYVCRLGAAVSGEGDARSYFVAASGTGDAAALYASEGASALCHVRLPVTGCAGVGYRQYAVSGLGDAYAGIGDAYTIGGDARSDGGRSVSVLGNASGGTPYSVAGTCDRRACVDVSPDGNARGRHAAVGAEGADCEGCLAVGVLGPAEGGFGGTAVSIMGDASSDNFVAVSVFGNATGGTAVSVFGDAERTPVAFAGNSVSVAGDARSCKWWIPDECNSASVLGDAEGYRAVSVTGDARCEGVPPDLAPAMGCVAVSVLGGASGDGTTFSARDALAGLLP